VPNAAQVSLCVEVARAQASSERGQAAQWTVSAWTTGGNVPDAVLRLQAAPASAGAPVFSFGCGKHDGASSCDLGVVDEKSTPRQLQAQLTVPVTASAVKSVSLTVTGAAAHLAKDPRVSAAVSITVPPPATAPPAAAVPPAVGAPPNAGDLPPVPETVTSPLPVGSLPGIPAGSPGSVPGITGVNPTLSPGGTVAGLFPTLHPKPTASPAQSDPRARTSPVANTSALPEGAPIVGAQLVGLAALAAAFVLAVTRLSVRRRTASAPPRLSVRRRTASAPPAAGTSAATPATPTPATPATPATPTTPATEQGSSATPAEPDQDAPAKDEDK
jgi:hypothetical protein